MISERDVMSLAEAVLRDMLDEAGEERSNNDDKHGSVSGDRYDPAYALLA